VAKMSATRNKHTLALIGCLLGISLFAMGCVVIDDDNGRHHRHHRHHHGYSQAATMHIGQADCPVCGNIIDSKIAADYKDKAVFFCSNDCRSVFAANPENFELALDRNSDKYLISVAIIQR